MSLAPLRRRISGAMRGSAAAPSAPSPRSTPTQRGLSRAFRGSPAFSSGERGTGAPSGAPRAAGGRSAARAGPPPPPARGEAIDLNPPRGTRDFYPADKRLQDWLFGKFRDTARRFGFETVDFPVLESEALFTRKAGEEISEQLYNFEDRGGRRVALRPELTPSLARLVLKSGPALPRPLKWCSVGQCWRYERSTRGRRREHYQWNMDVIGVEGVTAEAELLGAVVDLLSSVGLTSGDVTLRISSRKLLAGALAARGVPDEAFARAAVAVDKLDKLPREALVPLLTEATGLEPGAAASLLDLLTITGLDDLETALGADSPGLSDLRELLRLAEAGGYADWVKVDAGVVRGLAYYTGVVFEAADAAGQLRAVCGGGRYDALLGALGGAPEPAVGFGFGDAVIVELLRDRGLLPSLPHHVDDVVAALDSAQHREAVRLASRLRARGRAVDLVLDPRRPKWLLKHAERCAASRLVVIGPDEGARGTARVRDLTAREEREVPLAEIDIPEPAAVLGDA